MEHIPVLKDDVCKYLNLKKGEVVVDATLGLGGHASEILKIVGKNGMLIGFDQDERNLQEAKKRLAKYKNVIFIHDNFRSLKSMVEEAFSGKGRKKCNGKKAGCSERKINCSGTSKQKAKDKSVGEAGPKVDAIFFDLGISSPHVDDPSRGFSFMKDGPLDMRYSQDQKLTAYDIVNSYPEDKLADVIWKYGEERRSRWIAKKICERRRVEKFDSTLKLAEFIEKIIPVKHWGGKHYKRPNKHHPATQIFQALRIEVNDELNALEEALGDSIRILKVSGRIAVISYHSLEDRIVKHFFKELARSCVCPCEVLVCQCRGEPVVAILTKKPVVPGDKEIRENPRARSAKLRVAKKLRDL